MHPHRPPDVTVTLPPISAFTTPYAPAVPSRYTSDTTLNPPYASTHPPNALHRLPCLHSHTCLHAQEVTPTPPPISALTTPYTPAAPSGYTSDASSHLPNSLRCLPSLCFHIRPIGYGGLLPYTMNAITERC
ncbi:hypothetical protein O181_040320 [Austropuccinia psidii MF-1]|uniref:Uncharacterized protein n=1 Tax=Austropuccinia psidii MF-1 TaxID=1389203 RepID=A0A9Q3HG08_9BASI|nr:hypothetical protein [Austropuccinia psidii MF-1]